MYLDDSLNSWKCKNRTESPNPPPRLNTMQCPLVLKCFVDYFLSVFYQHQTTLRADNTSTIQIVLILCSMSTPNILRYNATFDDNILALTHFLSYLQTVNIFIKELTSTWHQFFTQIGAGRFPTSI